MPPSAMHGTPAARQASAASYTAVSCGTPTPATTRVVQIEPGPMPTLTASAPASIMACAPSRVAMLPPMICTSRKAGSFFRRRIMSSARRAWPFAVSTTSASTPASIRAEARCQASPRKPTPAATRRRPWPSLVASGYCSVLTKSLTVIRPASLPFSSISGSFSTLCWASRRWASSLEMFAGPVTRFSRVMTSLTLRWS